MQTTSFFKFSHMDVDYSEGRDVAEVGDGLPHRVVRRLQAELNQLAVAHCKNGEEIIHVIKITLRLRSVISVISLIKIITY